MSKRRPMQAIGSILNKKGTVGPSEHIGSFFQPMAASPPKTIGSFFTSIGGPIGDNRQLLNEQQWAYPRPSAAFYSNAGGPIRHHRQHFKIMLVGPFDTIGSILKQCWWAHSRPSAAF